jgi:hypothetical protein
MDNIFTDEHGDPMKEISGGADRGNADMDASQRPEMRR